jgi:hypothetical protein
MTIGDAYEMELEHRMDQLELPENQGEPFRWRDFLILTGLTVLLPLGVLLIGWFL